MKTPSHYVASALQYFMEEEILPVDLLVGRLAHPYHGTRAFDGVNERGVRGPWPHPSKTRREGQPRQLFCLGSQCRDQHSPQEWSEPAARKFYGSMLGMKEIEKPLPLRASGSMCDEPASL